MSTARVACLLVPDLPLRAELRARPEWADQPLVIASGPDARADIIALSAAALAAGVRGWSSVAQARSACPELHVRVASPALERAARETLLDVGLSLSPRTALAHRATGPFASEGCVFLDAAGVERLFDSERGFASALAARAERQGLPGVVSLASSRTVALLVARRIAGEGPGHIQVLAPEQESAWLAPLSLDLLDPDDELAAALTRFGVQTVQDLLRLPRRALAGRLGPPILELIARARGEGVETALPEPKSRRVEEAMDLEDPISALEPLGFVLRGLLSRLVDRLQLRGLACGALDLQLGLEGGVQDARRIGVASPTLDPRVLLRLITLALAEQPPHAALERLSVATEGHPWRTEQLDLFRPRGPDPTELRQTLSELESLFGEGRVGSPQVPDTHHPTAFALKPFEPPENGAQSSRHSPMRAENDTDIPPRLPAVRALRPPITASVRIDQGAPSHIRSAISHGHVVMAAGPWRTTGHWWSASRRFAFDHFDVQVSDGTVIRLCFDWIKRVWQIDGIYD